MKVTSGKQAQAAVSEAVRATPFTRIPGRLTRRDYITLRNEACEVACNIDSEYEWSGDYGHLAIVTGSPEYLTITTTSGTPITYIPKEAPGAFNPAITAATTEFQVRKKMAEWEAKREAWYTLCGVEEGLCKNFRDAVDEQYYRQLKKPIIGYRGIKIKTYLDHLETKWCKLDTNAITEMKASYYEKWNPTNHITDFVKRLDKDQAQLATSNITISNEDKLQFYIEQMYASRTFQRDAMMKWEEKAMANKTWDNAKAYFEEETSKEETYRNNSNGSTADSKYESAVNMEENTSDGDMLREYLDSIKETQKESAQKAEYLQQMSTTNETMANMNTKFQQQLSAQDDQIAALFKQNEAILEVLAKLSNDDKRPTQVKKEEKEKAAPNRGGKPRRPNPKRKPCNDCGSFHKPGECWEQPANKDKRPRNWVSRMDKPLE